MTTISSSKSYIFTVQLASKECTQNSGDKKVRINNGKDQQKGRLENMKMTKKRLMLRKSWATEMNDATKTSSIDGFYGILALMILTSSSLSATMIPVNNILINPEYWYEIIFSLASSAFFFACASTIGAEAVLAPFKTKMYQVIFFQFLTYMATTIFVTCTIHVLWSNLLGYFEPFPRRVHLIFFLSCLVGVGNLWNFVPLQKRKDLTFRRRWKVFVTYLLWNYCTIFQIIVIINLLFNVSRDYQSIMALAIPATKLINDFVADKIITKAALPKNILKGKFVVLITNNLVYSIAITISLTNATKTTEYLLLGINFCLNMLSCYKVIKLEKKVSPIGTEIKKEDCAKGQIVEELILNETIEMIVPLAFIGSFLMAYYGPNKDILGNIGCAIWQFKKIEGLAPLVAVAEMALLDSVSALLAGGLLWKFCRINIFHQYCGTIKKYWAHVAFKGGSFLSSVSTT